jgi:GTP-binding protein
MTKLKATLLPFLYPPLLRTLPRPNPSSSQSFLRRSPQYTTSLEPQDTPDHLDQPTHEPPSVPLSSHLNPSPADYNLTPFTDRCPLTLHSGSGGHGCVSFLREKYISDGPANGGDGGTGGSVYIQAVAGETSLHKLARRGIIKAGRGKNGRGKSKGGERGEDVLVKVPVGTVVREVTRWDPVALAEEEEARKAAEEPVEEDRMGRWRSDKWILYPGSLPSEFVTAAYPTLPRARRSNLRAVQPPAPISLDLDQPMEKPMLLASGAMGGLGNPHFATKSIPRPKFATKGEGGIRLTLELELKLLADVGLVGLPNAGKSTLLRSLSNSRARVGNWAFTTLQPNIGTVILDNHKGRPLVDGGAAKRTNFRIADIPGLIEDAHLDKGLGLDFLRHIERARVLAFVIDLSAGDAAQQLRDLWKEVGEYEVRKGEELNAATQELLVGWTTFENTTATSFAHDDGEDTTVVSPTPGRQLEPLHLPPISSKPWFVVATKADLPETSENYQVLRKYLESIQRGEQPHPSGRNNAWKRYLDAIPVSAIRGEGVEQLPELVVRLLDS